MMASHSGEPRLGRLDADIGAEHDELALRQIDHPHHAEDDGEPEADEDEDREGVADQIDVVGEELHGVFGADRMRIAIR